MTPSERRLQAQVDAAEARTWEQARKFDAERQSLNRSIDRLKGRVLALESDIGKPKGKEQEHTASNPSEPDTDETGRIVPMTDSKELATLRDEARRGNAIAQCGLGMAYQHGKGVPKNRASALKWYRLAAEQGNPQAQNNLGVMLLNGFLFARDEREAVSLIGKAARQGHQTAEANMIKINESGTRLVTNLEDATR